MSLRQKIALIVLLLLLFNGSAATVDQAIYVYEHREGAVPQEVQAALRDLNDEHNIEAIELDKDDDSEQYRIARDAADDIPQLVLLSNGRVIRVLKATTYDEVMDAVD